MAGLFHGLHRKVTVPLFLFGAILLFAATGAFGQSSSQNLSTVSATVTGTSTRVSNAKARRHLEFVNQSPTDTIYCTMDGTAAIASPTAKQLTFLPNGGGFSWTTGVIPSNEFNCVSTGSSSPLTIIE